MYQPDPVASVRSLARALRPRGLVVFQEHDSTMVPASLQPFPLHERVHAWIWRTVEAEGANIHMGFDLASVLERAGLTSAHVRAAGTFMSLRARAQAAWGPGAGPMGLDYFCERV